MDRTDIKQGFISFFRKYRAAALVLAVGLLLICYPENINSQPASVEQVIPQKPSLQQSLEELLSGLDGAGKVKVLLSISTGEQFFYQTDEDLKRHEASADQRKETVIVTSRDREERGLLQRTDPPTYLGALVLCQGADSAQVRLAVVDAVSTVTGLGADQISVLKMK